PLVPIGGNPSRVRPVGKPRRNGKEVGENDPSLGPRVDEIRAHDEFVVWVLGAIGQHHTRIVHAGAEQRGDGGLGQRPGCPPTENAGEHERPCERTRHSNRLQGLCHVAFSPLCSDPQRTPIRTGSMRIASRNCSPWASWLLVPLGGNRIVTFNQLVPFATACSEPLGDQPGGSLQPIANCSTGRIGLASGTSSIGRPSWLRYQVCGGMPSVW